MGKRSRVKGYEIAGPVVLMEWREVPGFPLYLISEKGDVRRGIRLVRGHLSCGYKRVDLVGPVGRKKALVHKLVALAFIGSPPPGKPLALHKDGTRTNNHHSNLYWGDHDDNASDAKRHGTSAIGERNHAAKLTPSQIDHARTLVGGRRRTGIVAALAREYGVECSTLLRAVRGHTWK